MVTSLIEAKLKLFYMVLSVIGTKLQLSRLGHLHVAVTTLTILLVFPQLHSSVAFISSWVLLLE